MSRTPAPAQAFVLELRVPATVAGLSMKAGMVPAQSARKLHTLTFLTNVDERLACSTESTRVLAAGEGEP